MNESGNWIVFFFKKKITLQHLKIIRSFEPRVSLYWVIRGKSPLLREIEFQNSIKNCSKKIPDITTANCHGNSIFHLPIDSGHENNHCHLAIDSGHGNNIFHLAIDSGYENTIFHLAIDSGIPKISVDDSVYLLLSGNSEYSYGSSTSKLEASINYIENSETLLGWLTGVSGIAAEIFFVSQIWYFHFALIKRLSFCAVLFSYVLLFWLTHNYRYDFD